MAPTRSEAIDTASLDRMTRRVGIGLTAGPSLATIDAALVEIDPNPIRLKPVELIEFLPVPVPPDLRARLVVARSGAAATPAAMSELDTEVGKLLADAAKKVAGARLGEVEFIASCGMPVARTSASSEESKSDDGAGAPPEVVRIGDAAVLARDTAKCVVSDFVPAESDETGVFSTADAVLFRHLLDDTRTVEWHRKPTADTSCALVVVHFGAMASMTALSGTGRVLRSFDCGPGNMVMNLIVQNAAALGLEPKDPKDEALAEKLQQPGGMRFDEGGKIAKGGRVYHGRTKDAPIDFAWTAPFFTRSPVRRGSEADFGMEFTKTFVDRFPKEPPVRFAEVGKEWRNVNDVVRTALEHAALCVMEGIASHVGAVSGSGNHLMGHSGSTGRVLISGGGAYNWALMARLRELGWKNLRFETSTECGIRADAAQAMRAATLGYLTLSGVAGPGDEEAAEGAGGAALGKVYTPGGDPAPVFEPVK